MGHCGRCIRWDTHIHVCKCVSMDGRSPWNRQLIRHTLLKTLIQRRRTRFCPLNGIIYRNVLSWCAFTIALHEIYVLGTLFVLYFFVSKMRRFGSQFLKCYFVKNQVELESRQTNHSRVQSIIPHRSHKYPILNYRDQHPVLYSLYQMACAFYGSKRRSWYKDAMFAVNFFKL